MSTRVVLWGNWFIFKGYVHFCQKLPDANTAWTYEMVLKTVRVNQCASKITFIHLLGTREHTRWSSFMSAQISLFFQICRQIDPICRQITKKCFWFFLCDLPADHKKKFIFMPKLWGSRARNGCLLRLQFLRKKILWPPNDQVEVFSMSYCV